MPIIVPIKTAKFAQNFNFSGKNFLSICQN